MVMSAMEKKKKKKKEVERWERNTGGQSGGGHFKPGRQTSPWMETWRRWESGHSRPCSYGTCIAGRGQQVQLPLGEACKAVLGGPRRSPWLELRDLGYWFSRFCPWTSTSITWGQVRKVQILSPHSTPAETETLRWNQAVYMCVLTCNWSDLKFTEGYKDNIEISLILSFP